MGLIRVDERQSSYFRKQALKKDNVFIGFCKVCPYWILNGNYNGISEPLHHGNKTATEFFSLDFVLFQYGLICQVK